MLSLYCSRLGTEAPTLRKKGILKSTNVLMELAMINWPEMLSVRLKNCIGRVRHAPVA